MSRGQLPLSKPERLWLILPTLFVAGLAIGLVPYLISNSFYYQDDMQYQFMPMFYHIGRLLHAGVFPYLTLSSWFGGNIAGEFQFAIYNPVSLALYAVLPWFQSYLAGAAFLACFYYGVLTAGSYVLARTYDLDRHWSWVIALSLACSNFLSYWAAANWFPNLSTCAWVVWSWALLRLAPHSRGGFLGAVAFSYLTISSGFPHTIIMLGFVCLLTIYQHWQELGWRAALAAPVSVFAAILLAAMPLLALAGIGGVGSRQNQIYNGDFLTPSLRDLLQISSASHFGFMNIYGGFGRLQVPIYYVAWFIMPLLPLLNWRLVSYKSPALIGLLCFIGFIVVAMQGPEDFFILRYFFRWMPYLHLAVLLSFFLVVQQAGLGYSKRRLGLSLALFALTLVTSLQVTPERAMTHLAFAAVALLGWVCFLLTRSKKRLSAGMLTLFVLVLFTLTHLQITSHGNFGELNSPREVSDPVSTPNRFAPETYSLSLGAQGSDGRDTREERFSNGYTFLESGMDMINGYSGISHRALVDLLCFNWRAESCPDGASRVTGKEPETGVSYLNLLRVDEITVEKGRNLKNLLLGLDESWTLAQDGEYGQRFVRSLPPSPGTVAWASKGINVRQAAEPTINGEYLDLWSSSDLPNTLVFARLWWPGYRAYLNGDGLPVRALNGIFVAVDLPPNASGTLNLFFSPPRQTVGLLVTGFGILLACLTALMHTRLFRLTGSGLIGSMSTRQS